MGNRIHIEVNGYPACGSRARRPALKSQAVWVRAGIFKCANCARTLYGEQALKLAERATVNGRDEHG